MCGSSGRRPWAGDRSESGRESRPICQAKCRIGPLTRSQTLDLEGRTVLFEGGHKSRYSTTFIVGTKKRLLSVEKTENLGGPEASEGLKCLRRLLHWLLSLEKAEILGGPEASECLKCLRGLLHWLQSLEKTEIPGGPEASECLKCFRRLLHWLISLEKTEILGSPEASEDLKSLQGLLQWLLSLEKTEIPGVLGLAQGPQSV